MLLYRSCPAVSCALLACFRLGRGKEKVRITHIYKRVSETEGGGGSLVGTHTCKRTRQSSTTSFFARNDAPIVDADAGSNVLFTYLTR